MKLVAVAVAVAVAVLAVGLAASAAAFGAHAAGVPPACQGKDLTGAFTAVRGSEGAGNIIYTLRLRNTSHSVCFVTGLPRVLLLGKSGKALPTNVRPEFPGALTAILVRLRPGMTTSANAQFSPDVPGVGEGHPGACEATAYALRVTPNGGGTLVAPISNPTAVCSHGRMGFWAYSIG
jgi:hypothetical protein